MGRPFKNNCEEIYIGSIRDRKFGLWQVKTPFYTKVTFKEKLGKYNDGKPIYGTGWEIKNKSISKKDEIIKEFLEKGKEVINIEEFCIPFLDICPLCGHNKGTPKIEKKSNKYDYYLKAGSPLPEESRRQKNEVNRPDEYRLIYKHKNYTCILSQFDKNNFLFKKNPKRNIELEKQFFPMCLEWVEKSVLLRLF